IPVMIEQDGIKVEGYIGRPSIARSNRNDENYYINSRYVKSKEISKGLEEGYKAFLMMHRFPFCVLHFSMDTTALDVNIHPNKMQVRMENPEIVVHLLSDHIHDALLEKDLIPQVKLVEETEKKEPVKAPEPFEVKRIENEKVSSSPVFADSTGTGTKEPEKNAESVRNKELPDNETQTGRNTESSHKNTDIDTEKKSSGIKPEEHFFQKQILFNDEEGAAVPVTFDSKVTGTLEEKVTGTLEEKVTGTLTPEVTGTQEPRNTVIVEKPEQFTLYDPEFFAKESKEEFEVIGQIFDTYWLITLGNKLFFMDQHAAHEKIKYEEFMKKFKEGNLESQNLLPPCILTLKPSEYVLFDHNREAFANLMFEIDDFGQDAIAIRAIPTDLFGYSCEELFMDILEELAGVYSTKSLTTVEERIATRACKAAIKGNTPLTKETAKQLIEMLFTLENPYQCPHGRPTLFSMSEYELEKKFKRIV
ncbi:MAG: DNA mismatch repair protein MutL, partial [Lachnospiraceae bacterium]|nr:DNA mismatch repair protein MutL [Lachnospiraceae bacterium]